jgi:hypothetical protein
VIVLELFNTLSISILNCALAIEKNSIKNKDIYKFLTFFYNNENIKNKKCIDRIGYSHTFRKMHSYHKNIKYIHPPVSKEIISSYKFEDYINIFNSCEYFISYDPLTYLQIISVLYCSGTYIKL